MGEYPHRTQARGRPPGRLRCTPRSETFHTLAHQGHLRATCTETLLVRAHQGQFRTKIHARGRVRCNLGPIPRRSLARARAPRAVPRTARRSPLRARPPRQRKRRRRIAPRDAATHQKPAKQDAHHQEAAETTGEWIGAGGASHPVTPQLTRRSQRRMRNHQEAPLCPRGRGGLRCGDFAEQIAKAPPAGLRGLFERT
jgi:hypothetical protein